MAGGARPAVGPQTLKEWMRRRDGWRVKIEGLDYTGWIEAWQNLPDYRRKDPGGLRRIRLRPRASDRQPKAQNHAITDNLNETHNAFHLETMQGPSLASKRS